MGADALLGAAVLVVLEWAVVGWLARGELAGWWELYNGLLWIVPIAWLVVIPAALLGSTVLVLGSSRWRGARVAVAGLAATFALAVGVGVSHGRHLAALPLRGAFVGVLGAAAFVAAWVLAPRLWRAVETFPRATAAGSAALGVALELTNRLVVPRLYPAFHWAIAVLTAMTAPMLGRGLSAAIGLATSGRSGWRRRPRVAVTAVAFVVIAAALAPRNARRLSLSDNLRLIFFQEAPLVGLGVEASALLSPPPPLDGPPVDEGRPDGRLEVDWRDRDILLISVDALRADHVGAYGYPKATTPNIDRLAREGTVFLRAYCPTPHTSYSVTSMMTGKNLRPLLVQGLGGDSDTFAAILRTYGYRTSAFYPPAVFFIDEELFAAFRDRQLDFEFSRVEFADPHQRARSLEKYLETQPAGQRLFVWVHLFEPHEPYVAHDDHRFGDRDIDRYDSEIAFADEGIGELVSAVTARRPNAVVIVTADHGEEFGEHGGRYHGTTVYEEQVRVPLVIAGLGVAKNRRVETPVQTIDILPTTLAALDIPRPPRVRGRSLGPWLSPSSPEATGPKSSHDATAFVVTDDQAMLGQDGWRLLCSRRAGACALHDIDIDPTETRDVSAVEPERFAAMKLSLRRVQASQGFYEGAGDRSTGDRTWPEAIRRGLAGDVEAAREVATLLDDSDVRFRRKAAELLFDWKSQETAPEMRLALQRDEDDVVRRFSALALTRLGEGAARAAPLLDDPDPTWRRLAALVLAENGDPRGASVLVAWWQAEPPPYLRAREILAALGRIRATEATRVLVGSLDDVRLRPYIAETLAAIGQTSARAPLAERWAAERYQNARVAIGDALVRLGAKRELVGPLVRFLGTPDPLPAGLELAQRAGVLDRVGGPTAVQLERIRSTAQEGLLVKFTVPPGGNGTGRRVLARAHVTDGRPGHLRIGARHIEPEPAAHDITLDFPDDGSTGESFARLPEELAGPTASEVRLVLLASANLAIDAIAVVPLSDDLPAPPPMPWGESQ